MESWFRKGLEPLYGASPLFASSDPQEAKLCTAGALKEHDLVWRPGKVDSVLRQACLGDLSFLLLRYGAAVHIAPGELRRFLLFQVPVSGAARITVGGEVVAADSRTGAVISPTLPLQLDWSEGCEQLLLKIPRERVERTCGALLGAELDEPVEFSPQISLDSAHGRAWQHQIGALLCWLNEPGRAMPAQWLRAQEEALIQHLLLCQKNNYSDMLLRRPVAARRLRAAEDYIRAHLQEAMDLAQIAQACGSSVRSLCAAFQEHYGQSPMAYVRRLRMDEARRELLAAPPGARVTDIALRWGFGHLGRFCTQYRQRYGETPAQSLRG